MSWVGNLGRTSLALSALIATTITGCKKQPHQPTPEEKYWARMVEDIRNAKAAKQTPKELVLPSDGMFPARVVLDRDDEIIPGLVPSAGGVYADQMPYVMYFLFDQTTVENLLSLVPKTNESELQQLGFELTRRAQEAQAATPGIVIIDPRMANQQAQFSTEYARENPNLRIGRAAQFVYGFTKAAKANMEGKPQEGIDDKGNQQVFGLVFKLRLQGISNHVFAIAFFEKNEQVVVVKDNFDALVKEAGGDMLKMFLEVVPKKYDFRPFIDIGHQNDRQR